MTQIASVRTLRNDYARLIAEVEAGATITIQRHGKPVAQLVPIAPTADDEKVDWTQSAAFRRKRNGKLLDAAVVQAVLDENKGRH